MKTRPDSDQLRCIMAAMGKARQKLPRKEAPSAKAAVLLREAMSRAIGVEETISALLAIHPHDEELLSLLRQCQELIQAIKKLARENAAQQARPAEQEMTYEGNRSPRRSPNRPTPSFKRK